MEDHETNRRTDIHVSNIEALCISSHDNRNITRILAFEVNFMYSVVTSKDVFLAFTEHLCNGRLELRTFLGSVGITDYYQHNTTMDYKSLRIVAIGGYHRLIGKIM